ncbi:MAG: 6,7-dimethyl-8-ribityllumazine synthase [Thermoanaerobaculia bacterium]
MREPIEGELNAEGLRFAVIAARFNDEIATKLFEGALDCLERHGAGSESVRAFRVPGAFELPATAQRIIETKSVDAVIAIGVLVRGDTPHFDFISSAVSSELCRISTQSGIPVAFGVITCDTMDQARARARKGSNKGWEAALAAIQMANVFRAIQ